MSNLELLRALAALPLQRLQEPAMVYPPGECPAKEAVAVTSLLVSAQPSDAVGAIILTGKNPT